MWRRHNFEGQQLKKDQFKNFKIETQRYSSCIKDISINELIVKKKDFDTFYPCQINSEIFGRVSKVKYGLLRQLFLKYVKLICTYHSLAENDYISFIVVSLVSYFSDCDKDFEPQFLWQLTNNKYAQEANLFIDDVTSAYQSMETTDKDFADLECDIDKSHISLFGEFLYFISTMHTDSDSPMIQIRNQATEGECLLIDELAMAVTPKLGILTFIAFRNYSALHDNSIVFEIFNNDEQFVEFYPIIQLSYATLMREIRRIPLLSDYYDKFLSHLGTELFHSADRFGSELLEREHLISLEEIDRDLSSDYGEIYIGRLVLILRSVADIFLFLRKESKSDDLNFKAFMNLPKYFKKFYILEDMCYIKGKLWKKDDCIESGNAMLMALSLLMDFIFIDNWQSALATDYVSLCNEMTAHLGSTKEHIVEVAVFSALFPFM